MQPVLWHWCHADIKHYFLHWRRNFFLHLHWKFWELSQWSLLEMIVNCREIFDGAHIPVQIPDKCTDRLRMMSVDNLLSRTKTFTQKTSSRVNELKTVQQSPGFRLAEWRFSCAKATYWSTWLLWSPYIIGQTIILSSCFFLSSSFFFLWSPYVIGQTIIFSCCFFLSLWSPYVIGQTIIFLPCDFYLSIYLFFLLFFLA